MNTRQIIAYAKDNGFNSVKFSIKRNGQHLVAGKFLDAYFEFVQIPFLGNGFVTIQQLEDQLGYDIEFEVLSEDAYLPVVGLDFILRGQEVPEEFALKDGADNE